MELYLVNGTKNYKGWTGDTTEEHMKILVAAENEDLAKERIKHLIDNVDYIRPIYTGLTGFDDNIYVL